MTRLLIANDCREQIAGQNLDFSKDMALWSLCILWHIKDNDILILPIKPDSGHIKYITALLGVNDESLQIVVAPSGDYDNLSPDRLKNQELKMQVRKALAGRQVESILSITPDAAVVSFARSLGLENIVPGSSFASQKGGTLANSKAIFRAIAAGANVPIPQGIVTNDSEEAIDFIKDMMLNKKHHVIVKKDFAQGCKGNEILSPIEGISPNGGRRGLTLPTQTSIESYIAKTWDWLTVNGHHNVVLEHYYPESIAIFAEFNVTNEGVFFSGLGEMLAAPMADGQVIPPVGLSPTIIAEIIDGGHRLSAALHTIGYRGMLSADAIVTQDATVLFSEYNGRITGSTHIYSAIGERIVGKKWMQKRILLERRGWCADSFQHAVDMLHNANLDYNHNTHTGIVLTGTFSPTRKVISYTIIAESLQDAIHLEKQLHSISPRTL